MATTATKTNYVIDVTDQTFQQEVLERSKTTPVVVDFSAAWCGPCRMLGPILERLAEEFQGDFILAKVDVDANQRIAQQFRVQGIPAVKAFRNGQMVGEFTGAQPEPQVRKFLEGLVPSEADTLAQQAYQWEMNDQPTRAEQNYRTALEQKPDHFPAKIGLGRILINQGRVEEGVSVLETIPAGVKERDVAEALIANAEFHRHAAGQNEADLRAKIEADPSDVASRYALASLLASRQKYAAAMDQFLEIIRRDRHYNDDGARKAMLAIFTILGEDKEIIRRYRQQLANALF